MSEYCAATPEQEFLTLINNYRVTHGLGKLAMSQTLGAAAQHHALDMATTGTLSHTLSDGTLWSTNIVNHGYPYSGRGENIAWGADAETAQSVFDAWRGSATHNDNMLYSGFAAIGISRVYDPTLSSRYNWVTTFGSRLDTAATLCAGTTQPTATAVPPTATPTIAVPTATSVPPTATPTTVPATATATAVPPTATNTAVPPTLAEVPAAPTQLTLSVKPRFIQLSWKDNATNENGYRVYRSTDGGATWNVLADRLPVNTTRFKDNNPVIQNGRTAYYVVTAYNANGESAPSTSESAVVKAKK